MKRRASTLSSVLIAIAILAGCGSAPPPNLTYGGLAAPDSSLRRDGERMTVAPLDILEIKVFGVADLNGDYQVDPEGRIKFPLIGIMQADGYSAFDLALQIEQKLAEGFLQDPQVTVRISEASGALLTVEGAVAKPGMYPVRGDVTLLQAIAVSGGPTRTADPSRVVIFRTIGGQRMAAGFDLEKIRTGEAEDPLVYGNDIIVMDGSGFREGFDDFIRTVPLLGLFIAAG